MFRALRWIGVAFGSFVAAWLCVGLVGGIAMFTLGIPASPASGIIATVASVVLGWLIYRDIARRERRSA